MAERGGPGTPGPGGPAVEGLLAVAVHRCSYVRADSTSLTIFRHYIVEVFMRRTDSTSLRSLTVSPPFRA
ncbi:MAG: hypothetical protein ACXWO1_05880, partial [Isosphaeraceae bacterium]